MELTIKKVPGRYFHSWNEGFISKNGDSIRSCITGCWGHSGLTKPQEYGYDLDAVLMDE